MNSVARPPCWTVFGTTCAYFLDLLKLPEGPPVTLAFKYGRISNLWQVQGWIYAPFYIMHPQDHFPYHYWERESRRSDFILVICLITI